MIRLEHHVASIDPALDALVLGPQTTEKGKGLTPGAPIHLLRLGKIFDRRTGKLVLEITEELIVSLTLTFEGPIPIDWNHGSAVAFDDPEASASLGEVVKVFAVAGKGLFGHPRYNDRGLQVLRDNGATLFTSPEFDPTGDAFDRSTGKKLGNGQLAAVALTNRPRQDRMERVMLADQIQTSGASLPAVGREQEESMSAKQTTASPPEAGGTSLGGGGDSAAAILAIGAQLAAIRAHIGMVEGEEKEEEGEEAEDKELVDGEEATPEEEEDKEALAALVKANDIEGLLKLAEGANGQGPALLAAVIKAQGIRLNALEAGNVAAKRETLLADAGRNYTKPERAFAKTLLAADRDGKLFGEWNKLRGKGAIPLGQITHGKGRPPGLDLEDGEKQLELERALQEKALMAEHGITYPDAVVMLAEQRPELYKGTL